MSPAPEHLPPGSPGLSADPPPCGACPAVLGPPWGAAVPPLVSLQQLPNGGSAPFCSCHPFWPLCSPVGGFTLAAHPFLSLRSPSLCPMPVSQVLSAARPPDTWFSLRPRARSARLQPLSQPLEPPQCPSQPGCPPVLQAPGAPCAPASASAARAAHLAEVPGRQPPACARREGGCLRSTCPSGCYSASECPPPGAERCQVTDLLMY